MTPKDTGRTIAGHGHIPHDADACAGVIARHRGKPGGGRLAEYADSALTPDTLAVTVEVAPEDTGLVALPRLAHDAEACTDRFAEYASVTLTSDTAAVSSISFTEYADCAQTADTVAELAAVTPKDAGRIARGRTPMNTETCSRVLP